MSTNTIIDLQKLYKATFNTTPYYIPNQSKQSEVQEVGYYIANKNARPKGTIQKNKHDQPFNKIGSYGQEIWGAITLKLLSGLSIEIEACTVAVNLNKTIIKTVVAERKGTVKECFNTDDYKFTIKGFLIDKNRSFPEDQINTLKSIFESTEKVSLLGGYPEMFLTDIGYVAIETLDFPAVEGKAPWIRPFQMTCESDYVQDLIIK
jgi:hypothetical protein